MKAVSLFLMMMFVLVPETKKSSEPWYTVKFHSLCDELGRNVTPERALKKGKLTAFNIVQDTLKNDTVRVSFDFISNCCEVYEGSASIVNDTLNLVYQQMSAQTCRCICDYRFAYAITDTTKTWSGIKIRRQRYKPQ